jgi:hypothetical protein
VANPERGFGKKQGRPPASANNPLTYHGWRIFMAKRLLLSTLFNEPRPIRYDWLAEVGKVPGKSLHLGIALAWMAVVRGGPRVRLGRRVMARFSLSRDACYDGLTASGGPGADHSLAFTRTIADGDADGARIGRENSADLSDDFLDWRKSSVKFEINKTAVHQSI